LESRDLEKASRESRKKAAVENTKSGSVEWWKRKNTTRRSGFWKTGAWSWDVDGMGLCECGAIIFGQV